MLSLGGLQLLPGCRQLTLFLVDLQTKKQNKTCLSREEYLQQVEKKYYRPVTEHEKKNLKIPLKYKA